MTATASGTAAESTDSTQSRLALVTGATGYVGGRVAAELLRRGWRVRVLSRSAERVRQQPWGDTVVDGSAGPGQCEVVEGDASDADDLARALADVDVAWYLLHSMGESNGDFVEGERRMAQTFAGAARSAGVSRIVYLGGLHPDDVPTEELSDHLRSRVEVGRVLMGSGVPTAALQAGVVIGDGSSSFTMLRHLAERLPLAVAPSWVRNRIQPIAVEDAVHYLVGAADLPPEVNRTFDIGGPDALEYAQMLQEYARALDKLPRAVLTAPVTTPELAAHWIGLITPVNTTLATPLIGSLQHHTVVSERDLDDLVGPPAGGHTSFTDAVRRSTKNLDTRRWARTAWACGGAAVATALVGAVATSPDSRWYRRLRKPSWQPPAAAFPAVWTPLYADIAFVAALCLADLAEEGRDDERRRYLTALGTNLVLNAGWSVVFFRGHKLGLATLESLLLAASSADLVRRSAAVSTERGVVLAPYAAWTGFASILTATIGHLNRRR